MTQGPGKLTELLREWSAGDPDALNRLTPMVLDQARAMARRVLALESRDQTLEPTDLVHEVYLRLVSREVYWWRDRRQFFHCLAELMRRVLVDKARKHRTIKRGAGVKPMSLDDVIVSNDGPDPELLLLNDALDVLKALSERKYNVIMLWFFVGLTQQEIAEELDISVNTVARDWQAARLILQDEMRRSPTDPSEPTGPADPTDP